MTIEIHEKSYNDRWREQLMKLELMHTLDIVQNIIHKELRYIGDRYTYKILYKGKHVGGVYISSCHYEDDDMFTLRLSAGFESSQRMIRKQKTKEIDEKVDRMLHEKRKDRWQCVRSEDYPNAYSNLYLWKLSSKYKHFREDAYDNLIECYFEAIRTIEDCLKDMDNSNGGTK
jgi:hypothetical protein